MKVICTQENLNKGLSLVANIANHNSNLPILNNVLLKADKDGLILITTDLEIGVKVMVRGKVEEEGEFTVDAKLFNNFVNYLPKENIELIVKDGSLEIKSKNQKTTIKGLGAEDFPLIPEIERENEATLNTIDLKQSLQQTVSAASLDASRVEINAVNFVFERNQLTLAATDSYRLAEKKTTTTNTTDINLIVPLKTLQELTRILNEQSEQKVKIYFNENQILFTFDGVELISRVIDGKYPEYQQIIPTTFNVTAKTSTKDLVPAIKSVALFCKQGINDIRLSFDAKTQSVVIATASTSSGNSIAKVPAEIEGENIDVVFNYRYLLDGLSNINSYDAVLRISTNNTPGLIQAAGNNNYLYLIMPIRQ